MLIISKIDRYTANVGESNSFYLNRLDVLGTRFLILVDKQKFTSVITDGDIRRELLDGSTLDDKCDWRKKRSYSIDFSLNYDAAKAKFLEIGEEVLPVLDERQRVKLLLTKRSLPSEHDGFIFAGGLGKRLRPLTDHTPKPLLRLAGKPLMEYVIGKIEETGASNLEISVNYLKHQFFEYFERRQNRPDLKINLIDEGVNLGTAGSLILSSSNQDGLIVSNADIVTDFDYSELVYEARRSNADMVIASREFAQTVPFGVLELKDGLVQQIVEKPEITNYVSAGIYFLRKGLLDLIPRGEHLDMPELINIAIEAGYSVRHCMIQNDWIDIGRPEQLDIAREKYE